MKTFFRIFTIIALVLAFTVQAQAKSKDKIPPEGRQALYKAQMLMDDKKYAEAAALISEYARTTEEKLHPQVYVTIGGASHLAGNKKAALKAFRKGHEVFPDNEILCMNTAVTLYELEQYAEAGKYLEKTFGLQSPGKPELLYQAGSAYYQGERYKSAARVLTKLISISKPPKTEWVRLAIHALLESKQVKQAEKILLTYLNLNPGDAAYWDMLARINLDKESHAKAAAALEISCRLKSPKRSKLEQLASLYRYLDAPLMAAQALERAYGNSPSPKDALKVAALKASAGRTKAAVSYLRKYSNTPTGLLQQGIMLYEARDFDKAQAVLTRTVKQSKAPEARFYLAMCAWEKKDWKTAKAHLSKLGGNKKFRQRAAGPLAVIEDLEMARAEASN